MKKSKYKVGNRIRIAPKPVTKLDLYWSDEMDKWCGQVMTIRSITDNGYYRMLEDHNEYYGHGWYWNDEMISGLADSTACLIAELTEERNIFQAKVTKIGLKISNHELTPYHADLLVIRQRALKTASMTLTAQIHDLENKRLTPEPESEKKYNVMAYEGTEAFDALFWYRMEYGSLNTDDAAGNTDEEQQWTDEQIADYHLKAFKKIEVKIND